MKSREKKALLGISAVHSRGSLGAALSAVGVIGGLVSGLLGAACSVDVAAAPSTAERGGNPSTNTPATASDDGGTSAPLKPSGCPTPEVVAPADVPAGFLAPQKVTLVRVVDGDTAHFMFPGVAAEVIVRFLYVNTEETHDTRATQFGVNTSSKVEEYLKGAQEIMVAPEEDKKKKGSAHLDTYGRTLALVFADGELFQERLVREGWTPYYTQFGCALDPIHRALVWSEAEAKANERGVWAPGHPVDYSAVLKEWMGSSTCRPNPYKQPYCAK